MRQAAWRAVNAEATALRSAVRDVLKQLKQVLDEPKVYVTLVKLYLDHKGNVTCEEYRDMLRGEGLRKERRSEVYRIICARETAEAFVAETKQLGIRGALRAARKENKPSKQGNLDSVEPSKCSIVPRKPAERIVRMLDRLAELFRQQSGNSSGGPVDGVPAPVRQLECGIYLVRFTPASASHVEEPVLLETSV
jgi:hypothetical protein